MLRTLCSLYRKVSISGAANSAYRLPAPRPRFRLYCVARTSDLSNISPTDYSTGLPPSEELKGEAFKFRVSIAPTDVRRSIIVSEGDLASDEALWALYERWICYYNVRRTPDEMKSRFNNFKENATLVVGRALWCFADLTPQEFKPLIPYPPVWKEAKLKSTVLSSSAFQKASISGAATTYTLPAPHPRFSLFNAFSTSSKSDISAASPTAQATGCSNSIRSGTKVCESDLASDEAIWSLYERWRRHYKIHRTPDETKSRFNYFKERASSGRCIDWPYSDLSKQELAYMFRPCPFGMELERRAAQFVKELERKKALRSDKTDNGRVTV